MSRGRTVVLLLLALSLLGAYNHFNSSSGNETLNTIGVQMENPGDVRVVSVYGRDSCSYTRRMIESLQTMGIPFHYIDIDSAEANRAFHEKFGPTGLGGGRGYALPVVEYGGHASMRPSPDAIASAYRRGQ